MRTPFVFEEADERVTEKLAAFLALFLTPGDLVALHGELGAGKTTFARALIRAVLDDPRHEVPSPSFSLAQGYEEGRLALTHFDFYRLGGADELDELGLDEALESGVALIEWPERAGDALPSERLDIAFGDGPKRGTRRIALEGTGAWEKRLERLDAMMAFCAASSWRDARPSFLQGDASTRAYARLHRDGETAILMDSPSQSDGPPVRDGKPYSQLVHLAEDVRPFVAVAQALERAGLSVPSIIAHDLERGFLITGDLGNRVYDGEPGEAPSLEQLYRSACDVLVRLKPHVPRAPLPLPDGSSHTVPDFDLEAFLVEAELLLDWFYEAVHGAAPDEKVRASFTHLFTDLYAAVEGRDAAWILRDYHSPNLLWLPEREGVERVGVIDFQDAMRGHAAYDLVSLLQDARRDIPVALEADLYAYYCEARARADSGFDAEGFCAAYAVLGAQRNSKILGIFARLAKRDGKHGYLAHIPRVSSYLERDLAHPALAGLRAWFAEHLPAELRERARSF